MAALRVVVFFTVLATLAVATLATNVQQCSGKTFENLSENVQLSPCKKLPCRLKKGTDQAITINITPEHDIADVKNSVKANVFGIDVPFLGVDGNSICTKLHLENGDKAECPLKAGTKYTYKDSFPVYEIYPQVRANVHWELQDASDEKPVICFEVPVRIQ